MWREFDPRADDPEASEAEYAARESAYRAALAAAKAKAEVLAAQRIAKGSPIIGTLLMPMSRTWGVPFFRELNLDTKFDIDATDFVTVNESATAAFKTRRAAESARQQAALAKLQPVRMPDDDGDEVDE